MSTNKPLLNKTIFKKGHGCANKLYFLGRPEFPSNHQENEILKALGDGGFQVGELAKVYHEGGIEVKTYEIEKALEDTKKLMMMDHVTIFEGAFSFGPFFVRIDILEKNGNSVKVTEVKSKTFDSERVREFGFFDKRRKNLISEWEQYLIDVAFQKYVFSKAYPNLTVSSDFMLVDKTKKATVDGLNQKFLILPNSDPWKRIKVARDVNKNTVGVQLLEKICIDEEVQFLFDKSYDGKSFSEYVAWLAGIYQERIFPATPPAHSCSGCEFRISEEKKREGYFSGFDYCFTAMENIRAADLGKRFVFDISHFWREADKLIKAKRYFAEDLQQSDINLKDKSDGLGFSRSQRQWIQVESLKDTEKREWIRTEELRSEVESWKYPLHFIDFETTSVALPFSIGRKPFEQIAFQFSHHKITSDGRISHETQYINTYPGKFPNFEFVRALKRALEQDQGTIFHFYPHEEWTLIEIKKQIMDLDQPLEDSLQLVEFIDSITCGKEKSKLGLENRGMVDLCEVVERYYFHRDIGRKVSIKKVFPAILNESRYIKDKYSKKLSEIRINSLSNHDCIIVQFDGDAVIDPYKSLPQVFENLDVQEESGAEDAFVGSDLRVGSAAMIAYARMQFSEMGEVERQKVKDALLRYCELDTLAMVIIWDYFKNDLLTRPR